MPLAFRSLGVLFFYHITINRNVGFFAQLILRSEPAYSLLFNTNGHEKIMTRNFTVIALALLLFQSCSWGEDISNLKTPEWDGAIAAPIAKGSVTIGEALNQLEDFTFLDVEPDGTLVFKADFPLAAWAIPELIDIPDVTFPVPDGGVDVAFPVEGVERMDFSSGQLDYSITNSSDLELRVVFEIRELTNNGASSTISVNVDGAGTFGGMVDLTGYQIAPNQGRVFVAYQAFEQSTGSPANIDHLICTLSGLEASYLEGRLPETDLSLEMDTLNLIADLGFDLSGITLADPALDFVFECQLGVPNTFSFPSFAMFDNDNIATSLIYEPFNMGTSLNLATEPGEWTETRFSINQGNSNISDLLNKGIPAGIAYEASILAFPAESLETGFITNQDSIRVTVELEAPLAFQLEDTEFTQDIALDFEMIDLLKSGTLVLNTTNEIPLELDLQVYLTGGKGQVIDSVFAFQQPILTGAEVDAAGFTSNEAKGRVEFTFNEDLLAALEEANGLRFSATVSSTQDGSKTVRLTDGQAIGFQLGLRTE